MAKARFNICYWPYGFCLLSNRASTELNWTEMKWNEQKSWKEDCNKSFYQTWQWTWTCANKCLHQQAGGSCHFRDWTLQNMSGHAKQQQQTPVLTGDAACLGSQLLLTFVPRRLLSPWLWKPYVPPKRRFLQEPCGVISQKTAFFIVNDVAMMLCPSGADFKAAPQYEFENTSYLRTSSVSYWIAQTNWAKCGSLPYGSTGKCNELP
jgi:hypothetical protein